MITGFNTDIEYGGVTYHVQTEDKGLSKPMILSLVYDRGTILASKRVSYEDMLGANFSEKVLSDKLHKQHRLICAAIKAGRIEDLKLMTAREAANAKQSGFNPRLAKVAAPVRESATTKKAEVTGGAAHPSRSLAAEKFFDLPFVEPLETYSDDRNGVFETEASAESLSEALLENQNDFFEAETPIRPSIATPTFRQDNGVADLENPIPKPFFDDVFDAPATVEEAMVDGISIIDDDIVLPAEAVAIIDELDFAERPTKNRLSIEILGDIKFRGGERNTVGFMVSRGSSRKVVTGAQIMVKILGSSFRPVIFHASTDNNGVATVNLQLPNFTSGRAAFLVRAMSDGEEIELRRSIAHG